MNCAQISRQKIEIIFRAKRVDFFWTKKQTTMLHQLCVKFKFKIWVFFLREARRKFWNFHTNKQTRKKQTNKQENKQTNKQQKKQTKNNNNNNNNLASGAPGGLEKQISSYTLSLSGVKKRRPTNKVLWEQQTNNNGRGVSAFSWFAERGST